MKVQWIFLIFCLGILALFSSCSKKKAITYYIDNSFKEWVLFQKGSYWVYFNDSSHMLDSAFVDMQPRYGLSPPETEHMDHYQSIYYTVTSSFIRDVYIGRDPDESYVAIGFFYPKNDVFKALNSGYTNGSWNGSSSFTSLIEKIDTMILNYKKFTNVIHTRTNEVIYDSSQYDFYFAKNIGLIKFSAKTNSFDSTWSLMRWHIIQ